jgi:hypothetical protein
MTTILLRPGTQGLERDEGYAGPVSGVNVRIARPETLPATLGNLLCGVSVLVDAALVLS